MGGRNPERHWPHVAFITALTLGDLKRLGWRLRARCPECRAVLAVDLDQRIRTQGEFAILWGRRARCPVVRGYDEQVCGGRMVFEVSGAVGQPFRPMSELPSQDYLRRVGRKVYDGDSDVVIW